MKHLAWLVVFCLAVGVEMVLEHFNWADSIGFWYTAYSAAIHTGILFAGFVIVRFVVRKVRGSESKSKGPAAN